MVLETEFDTAEIQAAPRGEQFAAVPALEVAFGHTVTALVRVLAELFRQIGGGSAV
jgi:hypothetical protein